MRLVVLILHIIFAWIMLDLCHSQSLCTVAPPGVAATPSPSLCTVVPPGGAVPVHTVMHKGGSPRRVRFSPFLVTSIKSRPATLDQDKAILYCTKADIHKRRRREQLYRKSSGGYTLEPRQKWIREQHRLKTLAGQKGGRRRQPRDDQKKSALKLSISSKGGKEHSLKEEKKSTIVSTPTGPSVAGAGAIDIQGALPTPKPLNEVCEGLGSMPEKITELPLAPVTTQDGNIASATRDKHGKETCARIAPPQPLVEGGEGSMHRSLYIIASVAHSPLRIAMPCNQLGIRNYESLVDATLIPLGGHHHRIIATHKPRNNSHGIVVGISGNRLIWTWPQLAVGDIGLSPRGTWTPVQGALREGALANHIQCNQFCEIANQGGQVVASVYGTLQLHFPIPDATMLEKVKTYPRIENVENHRPRKSALSPLAPTFHYAPTIDQNTWRGTSHKLSPMAPAFRPASTGISITNDIIDGSGKRGEQKTSTVLMPSAADPCEHPKERLQRLIDNDLTLLRELGLEGLVKLKRPRGDFASLDNIDHPARRLLKDLKYRGAPVRFTTEPWSVDKVSYALARGAHRSCLGHLDFLHEEFEDMINKGQWLILPASAVKDWPGLRYSPPGVVPQRGRRPRWIVDYSFWGINEETLPLAALESMQFGSALDRILREILLADPSFGPVQLMKVDLSDGFYRINLNVSDIPKLGVVFPTESGEEPLVAFPLVLPMGWSNSPPIFSTATETIADLANHRLRDQTSPPAPHPLDDKAEQVAPDDPRQQPASTTTLSYRDVLLSSSNHHSSSALPLPPKRDPSLPSRTHPLAYVDVFVDDFLALAQEYSNGRRVRKILLHAIDDVFRPLDSQDGPFRRQPTSLKKLEKGDCSWSTIKIILGWIIDTTTMTVQLPPHRLERLSEILCSIPVTQKRTSVRKWHKVLGELRSMALALPGAKHLFSHMQFALSNKLKGRVALNKGVHHALDDFRWILSDIENRPTRIAELVPLLASAEGHHDASGLGAGGVWFPAEHLTPRKGFDNNPVVWRIKWPQYIIDRLVTSTNPNGTISNSDLELAGGLLHLDALSQTFDIRERTVLSKTDNLNTLFWQRKGSATTEKVPAHLLRLFGIHQRFHRYVPRHDYLAGPSNPIADALSRDFELSWRELFDSLRAYLPAGKQCQIWTPTPKVVSAVLAALLKKRQTPDMLLTVPPPAQQQDIRRQPPPPQPTLQWPSTPLSKPSKTKYSTYTKSADEFLPEDVLPQAIPSGLDRLKVPYGTLKRRPMIWGPRYS